MLQFQSNASINKKGIQNPGALFFCTFLIFYLAMAYSMHMQANPLINKKYSVLDFNELTADTSEVFTVVDEMPEIIGGLAELYKHIRYPMAAQRAGIEGRVFIQFIVDKEGYPQDPVILRDIGGGCGEAAIYALENIRFTPGLLNGKPVKVQYSLPITFRINN